jgi:hypothetical protein
LRTHQLFGPLDERVARLHSGGTRNVKTLPTISAADSFSVNRSQDGIAPPKPFGRSNVGTTTGWTIHELGSG